MRVTSRGTRRACGGTDSLRFGWIVYWDSTPSVLDLVIPRLQRLPRLAPLHPLVLYLDHHLSQVTNASKIRWRTLSASVGSLLAIGSIRSRKSTSCDCKSESWVVYVGAVGVDEPETAAEASARRGSEDRARASRTRAMADSHEGVFVENGLDSREEGRAEIGLQDVASCDDQVALHRNGFGGGSPSIIRRTGVTDKTFRLEARWM